MDEDSTLPAGAGGAMTREETPDWEAIKEAYERGFDPLVTIARQHGVKYRQIAVQAHRHKWRRLAMEGAGANSLEVQVGAMATDLRKALQRQLKGLDANLRTAMKRKNVTAAAKLNIVNATIRGLMGATGIVEKVLKINARNAARVEQLRTRHGGDDPKGEFERRLAAHLAAARDSDLPEKADGG